MGATSASDVGHELTGVGDMAELGPRKSPGRGACALHGGWIDRFKVARATDSRFSCVGFTSMCGGTSCAEAVVSMTVHCCRRACLTGDASA